MTYGMQMAKSSPDSRPLKRSFLEKESSFNDLLTAAKRVRSEAHASNAENSDTTDDSGSSRQRGEGMRGLPEQANDENIHLTKYIGVRWSTKKAKWRLSHYKFRSGMPYFILTKNDRVLQSAY
jgi:hypothetical protein